MVLVRYKEMEIRLVELLQVRSKREQQKKARREV